MSKPLKPNFEYLSCIENYGCGTDAVYKDLSLHCVSDHSSSPQQCYVVTTDDILKVPTVVSAPVFPDKSHTLSAPSNGCVVERASHNGRDVITKINCAAPESRTTTFLSAIATQRIHAGGSEECKKVNDYLQICGELPPQTEPATHSGQSPTCYTRMKASIDKNWKIRGALEG